MTLREVITRVSGLNGAHQFSEEILVSWLSKLDGMIKNDLIDLYEGAENITFIPYKHNTDMDKTLLVPYPYDELYVYYLLQQINASSEENVRANNKADLFQNALQAYRTHYIKTHMPKSHGGFNL